MTEVKNWTPRERGWVAGYAWAKHYEGDPCDLQATADGEVSGDTKATIASLFIETDDLGNPSFSEGFSHGVGAYLALEEGITTRSNRPVKL